VSEKIRNRGVFEEINGFLKFEKGGFSIPDVEVGDSERIKPGYFTEMEGGVHIGSG
jgi:hypothetical protein